MYKSRAVLCSLILSACLLLSSSLAMAVPPDKGVGIWDSTIGGGSSYILFDTIEAPAMASVDFTAPDWNVQHETQILSAGGLYMAKTVISFDHVICSVTSSSNLTDNAIPFEVGWRMS